MIVFDDVGSLDVEGDAASFTGRKYAVSLRVAQAELRSQAWNRTAYLWINLATLPFYFALFALLYAFGIRGLFLAAAIVVALLGIAGSNVLGYLIGQGTKWLVLTGESVDGEPVTGYFADGQLLGWSGMLGGTSRMFESVRRLTKASSRRREVD
jgi:hypothetical protein